MSPQVFSGVRVTRSFVLFVCFENRCPFFYFCHCIIFNMFVIKLNVQKDSLTYKWNLFGCTFTSYESILSLSLLPFCL
jgi:hypothetical protein